jgi:hypothetical protein
MKDIIARLLCEKVVLCSAQNEKVILTLEKNERYNFLYHVKSEAVGAFREGTASFSTLFFARRYYKKLVEKYNLKEVTNE